MDSKERNAETYLPQEEERALIRAAQAGDLDARDQLILAATPIVRKILGRLYPDIDHHDAQDLMQESVPVLYDCIRRYDLSHPARARLYVFAETTLRGAASEYFRHKQILHYSNTPPEITDDSSLEKTVLSTQIEKLVRAALATMSITDQDLLMSRHGAERKMTRAKMAQRYDCPPHVIEYAEKRACQRFEKAFDAISKSPKFV